MWLDTDLLDMSMQLTGSLNLNKTNMSNIARKGSLKFPTRSDANPAVQPQKMARCLKFRILKQEDLYFPCSENKGADQLHS